jgi:hypothetical protein
MENEVYDAEAIERLNAKSVRDEATGCLNVRLTPTRSYATIEYRTKRYFAHRLSYIAHRGPIPKGLLVCHRCDNPACIAIEHLFLGTPRQNCEDMWQKGRHRYGTCSRGTAKINVALVAEVKRRIAAGQMGYQIVRDLAPSKLTLRIVSNIRRGIAWREVAAAEPPAEQVSLEQIGEQAET